MPKTLNGWQRLSVVLAVLWTLIVGLVALGGLNELPQRPTTIDFTPIDPAGPTEKIEPSDSALAEWRSELKDGRRRVALEALMLWLLPPLALNAAGLTVNWVHRGFRLPPETPQ